MPDKPDNAVENYNELLSIIKARKTCRGFTADPVPDEYIEYMLEAARWAPSGANAQPWSFIVIKDPDVRKQVLDAYNEYNMDFIYWVEQQRRPDLRHPAFRPSSSDLEDDLRLKTERTPFRDAPVIIAVVGDGRKQWATVMGAHTFSLDQTHLTDGMSNATLLLQLAGAALGLATQWVTIHIQEPFKQILGIPAPLVLHTIVPVGYPSAQTASKRNPLDEMVHYDKYDMQKHLSNRQILERLAKLRGTTADAYTTVI